MCEPTSKKLAAIPERWPTWDGSPLPESAFLRWGYSTGACAVAAILASYYTVLGLRLGSHVSVLFNDGVVRSLPLTPPLPKWPNFCVLRKNGGDDPDCTHGILIAARMQQVVCPTHSPYDISVSVHEARVFLHVIQGIGLVTRPGLDCQEGHWAISTSVLTMLQNNLSQAGLRSGFWRVELLVPQGEEIAKRTLNASLGVIGGISLLGTTGLVRPFSHDAYIATIKICIRSAHDAGEAIMVLCTGGRTLKAAKTWCAQHRKKLVPTSQQLYPPLGDLAFTTIADFIGASLRLCAQYQIAQVLICCMPGKLLKYAVGHDNTHAHKVSQSLPVLAQELLALAPQATSLAQKLQSQPSMRAAMALLDAPLQRQLLTRLASKALHSLRRLFLDHRHHPRLGILVSDFSGQEILVFKEDKD